MPDIKKVTDRLPAWASLHDQVRRRAWEGSDWNGISLTEMWRASGTPEKSDPETWARENSFIFAGLAAMVIKTKLRHEVPGRQHNPLTIRGISCDLLDVCRDENCGPDDMNPGDVITDYEAVAAAYSMCLDMARDRSRGVEWTANFALGHEAGMAWAGGPATFEEVASFKGAGLPPDCTESEFFNPGDDEIDSVAEKIHSMITGKVIDRDASQDFWEAAAREVDVRNFEAAGFLEGFCGAVSSYGND
jgi:hypothetical protein